MSVTENITCPSCHGRGTMRVGIGYISPSNEFSRPAKRRLPCLTCAGSGATTLLQGLTTVIYERANISHTRAAIIACDVLTGQGVSPADRNRIGERIATIIEADLAP